MERNFSQLLEEVFLQNGFLLNSEQIEQLTMYCCELQRWNSHINLTTIIDDVDVIYKHFLDSVSVLEHCEIHSENNVIDIGSGAGFPGVVLKIYIPDIKLTLVEASQKKASFLKYLTSQLGFASSVNVFAERAEICSDNEQFMNSYDWVLTRFVASLEKSFAYCVPMLKPTGRWVAYKSSETELEINQNENRLHEFGVKIESVYNSRITRLNRSYIVIKRV